ncbi:MAG TPA: hypothetical protein VFD58_11840 [Blastocatellia bacterium]|nr:hypothetical protein [Blastocatellia bacterium]
MVAVNKSARLYAWERERLARQAAGQSLSGFQSALRASLASETLALPGKKLCVAAASA